VQLKVADDMKEVSAVADSVRQLKVADDMKEVRAVADSVRQLNVADDMKEVSAVADSVTQLNAGDDMKEVSVGADSVTQLNAGDDMKEVSVGADSVTQLVVVDAVEDSVAGEAPSLTFRISNLSLQIAFLPTSWIISASTNTRSTQRTTQKRTSTAGGDEWNSFGMGYGTVYSLTCPRKKKTT
jgi:hypothetical protein